MRLLCRCVFLGLTAFLVLSPLAAQNTGFTHTIAKGETVYSIAKVYGVSVEEIYALNPEARQGIKAGASLRLPQKKGGASGKFHTIAAGETLYKLTQLYKVSAESICAANPGLTAENFRTGQVVVIPESRSSETPQVPADAIKSNEPVRAQQQETVQSACREMHKVKRRETIYGIAKEYGVTEEALYRANPEMRQSDYKLKKGTFICIPYPEQKQVEKPVPTNEELLSRPAPIERMRNLRMAVLLPFQSDASKGARMVEYYRGLLMAVDSLKQGGTSVEVYAYDSGKTAADMKKTLQKPELAKADIIFGPLHNEQIAPLASFCKAHAIRCVMPFTSQGNDLYSNPYLYMVNAPKDYQYEEVNELTGNLFSSYNIVMLDAGETDESGRSLTASLKAAFKEQGIPVKQVKLSADAAAWSQVFAADRRNLIIPNSSSIKTLNQLFPKLKQFLQTHESYRFSLLGYPEWQTYTSSHLENFYQFDTYVYSTFYRKPLSEEVRLFEGKYMYWFKKPMISSYPRFGLLGFDTGYFFLKGLADYGKQSFDSYLPQMESPDYQQSFRFERVSNWGGFVNKKVKLIHYMPQQTIDLIDLVKQKK